MIREIGSGGGDGRGRGRDVVERLPVGQAADLRQIIYVVDPVTYRILYANKTLVKTFKKPLVGGICYEEFQGFKSPCKFCTNDVLFKNRSGQYQWEYYNPKLDRYFFIIDKLIKWTDGRDVRFEIAIDITARKKAETALLENGQMGEKT